MDTHLNVGMKCIKYMLFVANFMFVMVGVLLLAFGSTIKAIYKDFELFMEDHYFSPATLVIAIGIIIMLIALFGCYAAVKESTCMVNLFALMLMLALILELSASIAAYAMRGNIQLLLEHKMKDAMSDYTVDPESKDAIDFLQTRLGCCGIHNKEEWYLYNHTYPYKDTGYEPPKDADIPYSCCKINLKPTCVSYNYGCLDKLTYIISESAIMLGTGALCIAFVQILGIAFALMLAKSIRRLKSQAAAARWQTRHELYLQLARGNEKPATTPVVYAAEGNHADS